MDCDICHRQHHPRNLPFLCAVDARNHLYEGRILHARSLIENESIANQIDAVLSAPASDPSAGESSLSARAALQQIRSDQQAAIQRTDEIVAQADQLRSQLESARQHMQKMRQQNARRSSDLAAVSSGLSARRSRQLEEAERAIQMARYKWNRTSDVTAGTRGFLCTEAARLYGLKRIRKPGSVKYEIGGVDVIDMQSLISTPPEVISTSLAHIAHLLMLVSHYLHIRLPAEIMLPHRDHPRPTIYSISSSYQHPDPAFPLPSVSRPSSSSGDIRYQRTSRPRPLFVDHHLPALAKDEPLTYSLFVEGIALLAYDIAWLCCSQGVPIGDKDSFDDVCNMGRNLYSLLIGSHAYNKSISRLHPGAASSMDNQPSEAELAHFAKSANIFGKYSHGTAHGFLASAEGNEFVRGFRIPNPIKLADRLKKKLTSEAPTPDWEVLDDESWKAEPEVVEQSANQSAKARGKERTFSTGGWTKLKNR